MSYVVAATYRAKPGEEATVKEALSAMVSPTRGEEGCLEYRAHQSVEDPAVFFLYERYRSQDDFKSHMEADYFATHIKEATWPRLNSRERVFCEPLGGDE